jgi:putative SOS response-associated peptidase YedK
MCGRFTLTKTREEVAYEIGVPVEELPLDAYKKRYNIAPTDSHWIARVRLEDRELLPAKWGLVNSWAKDASKAARQINARAETLRTSGAFRDAFANRRCVVPADGFYEWIGTGASKQPVWFHRDDGGLIFFAGLYESWKAQPEEWQRTFTIITTEPNKVVAPVHNRMPVLLAEDEIDEWLNPREEDLDQLLKLLDPAPEEVLVPRTVSPKANSVKNDDPSVLEPAEVMGRLL